MAEDADQPSGWRAATDRRRFVQGAAALGAAGLAGCSHGDGEDGTTTEPTEGTPTSTPVPQGPEAIHGLPVHAALMEGAFRAPGDGVDTLHIPVGGGGPDAKNANWNPFGQQGAGPATGWMFTPQGKFNFRTAAVRYYLLEDVTGGVDHIDLKVRDEITWNDGEPFTAKDLWAGQHFNFVTTKFFQLKEYLPDPLEGDDYLELLEEENTVRIHLASPRLAHFFSLEFLIGGFDRASRFKHEQVSDVVDAARDALDDGDEEALSEVHRNFVGAGRRDAFRISDDEVFFHGPYMLKERQSNGVLLERNPEFPQNLFVQDADYADTAMNWEEIQGQALRNPQAQWKALTDGEIQLSNSQFSQVLVQGRPDHIRFESFGTWRGLGLCFDHTHVDFQHRPVRQAMAYAVGQEQIVKNRGETWTDPGGRPDGIRVGDEQFLGDAGEDFKSYAPQQGDTDKAAAKLREAGYTREDGEWYRPNGDRFSFGFIVRGAHAGIARTAVQQFTDFGIDVEQKTTSFGSYRSALGTKEWGIGLNWVWMFRPHPWFAYNHAMISEWIPKDLNYAGWHPDNGRTGEGNDAEPGEFVVEVPPVGEWDAEPEPVNVKDVHTKLGDPSSDISEEAGVTQLAWVYNYDLPKVPLITMKRGRFYNTQSDEGEWIATGN